jgi:polysaccharide biosynthesis protein PslH
MHQVTGGLLNLGVQVKVLAFSPKHQPSDSSRFPADYLKATAFEAIPIRTEVQLWPAFRNLFTGKSYNVERFRSQAMEKRVKEILQQQTFDIIQLEGLYLTPLLPVIRRFSKAAVVYRAHNIEHFIWKRMATACRTPIKRQYLKLLASRLEEYETAVIQQVDALAAITPVDEKYFIDRGFRGPSIVIPVGIPDQTLPDTFPEPEALSVFHLGSMDWRPNQEGIKWFLEHVWPLAVSRMPGLKFYLAGKRMPTSFYRYESDNVRVVGEVPDAMAFILSKKVMVVPLLSGGGMRVKIIEGLAAARPIVSTRIGAEGIPCRHREHLFLADGPEQMARWIVHCFQEPGSAERVARQAREFAVRHFRTDYIMKKLLKFYQDIGSG